MTFTFFCLCRISAHHSWLTSCRYCLLLLLLLQRVKPWVPAQETKLVTPRGMSLQQAVVAIRACAYFVQIVLAQSGLCRVCSYSMCDCSKLQQRTQKGVQYMSTDVLFPCWCCSTLSDVEKIVWLARLKIHASPGQQLCYLTQVFPLATHKLPNGVKTQFFHELEAGRTLMLPKTAEEFQELMELMLYDPSPYIFHHRLRAALVDMQKVKYCNWEQSKS